MSADTIYRTRETPDFSGVCNRAEFLRALFPPEFYDDGRLPHEALCAYAAEVRQRAGNDPRHAVRTFDRLLDAARAYARLLPPESPILTDDAGTSTPWMYRADSPEEWALRVAAFDFETDEREIDWTRPLEDGTDRTAAMVGLIEHARKRGCPVDAIAFAEEDLCCAYDSVPGITPEAVHRAVIEMAGQHCAACGKDVHPADDFCPGCEQPLDQQL